MNLGVVTPHHQINLVRSNRQVKWQLTSQVSKNTLHNFDKIVIVTHCTSPIKVGATVGTVFLHVSPYDGSHLEALPFKSRKSWEIDVGREKTEISSLLDFIRSLCFGLACWTSVSNLILGLKPPIDH